MSQQPASATTMQQLLAAQEHALPLIAFLQRGDVVEGQVLSVTPREAVVDLGSKAEGILPRSEFKTRSLKEGEQILVYVVTPEDRRGQTLLSLEKARAIKAWLDLERAYQEEKMLEVEVTGHNKGGLVVDFQGIAGFVPFSQLSLPPETGLSRPELQSLLDKRRSEKLKVKLIELAQERNRIIFSEVQAQEQELARTRQEALQQLKEGQDVKVAVSAVLPYGLEVAVPLSGRQKVKGLIETGQLAWEEKGRSLSDFSVGQKLRARVIKVEPTAGSLRLSLRELTQDPWEALAKKLQKSKKFRGEVSKMTSFGIYIKLLPEIEGLLPLSELPADEQKIEIGQKVAVRVAKIDLDKKQVELEWEK